jgi:hypothetical protein
VYSIHLKEKPSKLGTTCSICRDSFSTPQGLRMHLSTLHHRTALDDAYARARSLGLLR